MMPIQLMFPSKEIWRQTKDGDPDIREVFDRHYSRRHYKDGRKPSLFVGPGEKMVLRTASCDAIFIWRKFISADSQEGVNCSVFRNEGQEKSSRLIRKAVEIARTRWPEERFYTYVDGRKVRSSNPGCCFMKAGWRKCGRSKGGLVILELTSDSEGQAYAGSA